MATNKTFSKYKTEGIWQHFSRENVGFPLSVIYVRQNLKQMVVQLEDHMNTWSGCMASVCWNVKLKMTVMKRRSSCIRQQCVQMAVFESSGKRGRFMDQVCHYLMSVPPTSVEAECAFSSAGILCTKLRSSLGDEALDTRCFLQAYYEGCKAKWKQSKTQNNSIH